MAKSLLRRLLHAILLLGVISIIAFCLSKLAPGDEVLELLSIEDSRFSPSTDPAQYRMSYKTMAAKRGLDLPSFYFSIQPGFYSDSIRKILPTEDRQSVLKWVGVTKNNTGALHLYKDLLAGLSYACPRADTLVLADLVCEDINSMLNDADIYSIHQKVLRLHTAIAQNGNRDTRYAQIISTLNADVDKLIIASKKISPKQWLPAVHWNGAQNQYHQWMAGLITFKPLTSLVDGRNAWSKILDALKWTLLLNGSAFLLAIGLGILIGIWSATHDGFRTERLVNILLFALFAVPSFWLATLMIFSFSSGEWLSVFPSGGLGPYDSARGIVDKCRILLSHLTLPVLCLALGSLAYVSRQMKQSVVNQLNQPYVMSLRSLGVSEKSILRHHVVRNALFPMITLFGGALPALLSGSLIIEVIFSIPGMGRLIFSSLMARDWPVAFPILMFGATITVVSYILTDVIYKWADPRVKSMES